LTEDFEMLAEQPMLGRERNDLRPGLRAWIYSRHIAYYMLAERGVIIVRVLHVSRNVDPEAEF
jgi:toxin ParE1/3/4